MSPADARTSALTFWYFCHHVCERRSSREAGVAGTIRHLLRDSSCTAAMVEGSTHSGRICTFACWILGARTRHGVTFKVN